MKLVIFTLILMDHRNFVMSAALEGYEDSEGNVSGVDIYTTEIRDWVKRMEDEFKTTPLAR